MTITLLLDGCGGSSSSPASSQLNSAQVSASVNEPNSKLVNAARLLAPLRHIGDVAGTGGSGPAVTDQGEGTSTITVTLNYGNGLTEPGNETVSGVVTIVYHPATGVGQMNYTNVFVDGHSVVGTVPLSGIVINGSAISCVASPAVMLAGAGQIVGTLTVLLTATTVSIQTGTMVVTPDGTALPTTATINAIVIDPSVAGNLIPDAGSVEVAYPYYASGGSTAEMPVTFTFNSQSPITRSVDVTVNSMAPSPLVIANP